MTLKSLIVFEEGLDANGGQPSERAQDIREPNVSTAPRLKSSPCL